MKEEPDMRESRDDTDQENTGRENTDEREDTEMRDDYDLRGARRGAVVPPAPGKTRITIRLDNEVLAWFRGQVSQEGGGSYQSKINGALREHIERQGEPLEDLFRRVLREELGAGAEEAPQIEAKSA